MFAVLVFALVAVASAENESDYDGCTEKLDVLERALYDTGTNRFQLNAIFFPPSQRPTRFITVEYSFETDDEEDCKVDYIWAIGGFLFFQPPSVYKFTSLYFNHPNNNLTLLKLELPSECKDLVLPSQDSANCSCSHEAPLLSILTKQLDIYATFTEPGNIERRNSFARAICAENLNRLYYNHRPRFLFTVVCIAILAPFCFIVITFVLLRNVKESFSNSFSSHPGKLVGMVMVGITVSTGILACDILACQVALSSDHEYSEYVPRNSLNLMITIATLIMDSIFILPQVLSLFYIFYHNIKLFLGVKGHNTLWLSFLQKFTGLMIGIKGPQARQTISHDDAIGVILPFMLLPPFLCFSTHLGYILLAWLTEPNKCTIQVLLLYIALGFLFVMLKKCYKLNSAFTITFAITTNTANEATDGVELKALNSADISEKNVITSEINEAENPQVETTQAAGQPKDSLIENEMNDNITSREQGSQDEGRILSITYSDNDSTDSPSTHHRKKYVNTQAFCLMFLYGIFIIGIGAIVYLMFLLLPLASEEIVVYLFNALQLIILIVSTQLAYKVFLDSDGFSINKFWKNFRNHFAKKNEAEFCNKEMLSVVKDDDATNAKTAGVVAAELTEVIIKKLS